MRSAWSIAFTCEFHNSLLGFTFFVADWLRWVCGISHKYPLSYLIHKILEIPLI